ncbi:DUF916 domain-containing protein [Phytohabitans kaempferiae]|uniref:DUF916 domain-containing protein n=1 Tax=Phytohabitans kaempferiae TaxID=1620943 RepID=A0ABV6MD76_9ACTN
MSPARPARTRRSLRAGLLLAAVAVVAAGLPPTVAAASPSAAAQALPATPVREAPGDDYRWSVLPSSSTGPTVRSRFEYGLKPGEEVADWLAVSNLGRKPLKINVYGTDAFNAADGGFALLPASERPKDVGAWISLPGREYTVPVGKRVDIPFKLKIPANAEPGDHIGGLIASATETTTNAEGQQVNVERRVAARVYLRVDGPVQPVALITSVDVRYDNPAVPFGGGDMTVTYRVANDGNVRFSGKARIQVRGPLGVRVAHTEMIDIPELLPDSEVRITRTLEGVFPAGRLTAEVTVNPQTTAQTLPSMSQSHSLWAVPWLIVVVLVAAAAVLVLWLWRRRRARRDDLPVTFDPIPAEAGAKTRGLVLAAVALFAVGAPAAMDPSPAEVEIQVSIGPRATPSASPSPSPSPTASPTPPANPGGDLPRTGLAIGAFVAVGAALVGGGAGLRVLARRRPT